MTTVEITGLQLIDYLELEEQLPPGAIKQAPAPALGDGAHGSPALITAVVFLTAAAVQALTTWLSSRHARSAGKTESDEITVKPNPDGSITIRMGPYGQPARDAGNAPGGKVLSGVSAVTEAILRAGNNLSLSGRLPVGAGPRRRPGAGVGAQFTRVCQGTPPRAALVVEDGCLGYLLIMDKVVASAAEAVADIPDGATLAVGGFGLCGIPSVLIQAVLEAGTKDLEVVTNNAGVDDWGLGILLGAKRLRRIVASYVGENREFARQYLAGELEVELTPQGTLAERMRAGGSGIAAFFTRTGVGTQVAEGGMPWKYDGAGGVAVASPAKPTQVFDGLDYVLERAVVADFGLVRAWKGDRHGNLVFRDAARNFNPLAAMCGRLTIAEVEHLVDPGDINPNDVHTPGVYVQRVVALTEEQARDKRIEKRTVRAGGNG